MPVPDPRRIRKRIVLTGDVPTPINPPSGCHFHTRCPHAERGCAAEVPTLEAVGEGHRVACTRKDALDLSREEDISA